MTRRILGLAALALLLVGCAGTADRPAVERELRQRIQDGYVEPFRRGDVGRWVGVFTEDALALHDGPPAFQGREAIRAFGELVKANFEVRVLDLVVDEVRVERNWALTAGRYTADFEPRSKDAYAQAAGPRQGKFLFLWRREAGQWRIQVDMGNSTDAPATPGRGDGG